MTADDLSGIHTSEPWLRAVQWQWAILNAIKLRYMHSYYAVPIESQRVSLPVVTWHLYSSHRQ